MTAPPTTMARERPNTVGRKRAPPPKGRTFRARFARRLHVLAGDKSSKEIALACGVSHVAVSNWFTGNDFPSFDVLPDLAKVLRVSVRDLFENC